MNVLSRHLLLGVCLGLAGGLAACTEFKPASSTDLGAVSAVASMRCSPRVQSRLYFGLSTPDGVVNERQWQDFVDHEIAPRLPEGFTLQEARGQWRAANGSVQREDSRVLEVLGEDHLLQRLTLAEIAGRYKLKFQQETVWVSRAAVNLCE
jgi:hypothetical protein